MTFRKTGRKVTAVVRIDLILGCVTTIFCDCYLTEVNLLLQCEQLNF